QKDDIIIGVNRKRVKNIAELRAIMEKSPNILALNIQRGERTLYLVVR
ncbi:serine endoprotease DegQ, partial [Vibrio cholerae]|nr:serine endoprotease DegQ [Vibrio cholerae]